MILFVSRKKYDKLVERVQRLENYIDNGIYDEFADRSKVDDLAWELGTVTEDLEGDVDDARADLDELRVVVGDLEGRVDRLEDEDR